MTSPLLIRGVTSVLCVGMVAGPAWAWQASDCRATIRAPAEINLGNTKTIPIVVEVSTPEGAPFSGQIEVWADGGQFVRPDGATCFSPISVQVEGGRAEAVLWLDRSDERSPLGISATKGPYADAEVLAQAEVLIRYPEHITVSASVASVRADGMSRPAVAATIRDQFGEAMEDIEVVAKLNGPQARGMRMAGKTDARGHVSVALPASAKPGYALGQIVTERIASRMFRVLYAEEAVATMPLRDAAARIGAGLHWDSQTHTATATGANLRFQVRAGEAIARVNGEPIPLGTPALLRDGRIEVPVLFVQQILGLTL